MPPFHESYCDALIDYFRRNNPFDRISRPPSGRRKPPSPGTEVTFPTFAGFASEIGVPVEVVRRWATEVDADGDPINPAFANCYKRAQDIQTDALLNGGLSGLYDSEFTIFACKNLLGWSDAGGGGEVRPWPATAAPVDMQAPTGCTVKILQ